MGFYQQEDRKPLPGKRTQGDTDLGFHETHDFQGPGNQKAQAQWSDGHDANHPPSTGHKSQRSRGLQAFSDLGSAESRYPPPLVRSPSGDG
jgi:hypothetical protein